MATLVLLCFVRHCFICSTACILCSRSLAGDRSSCRYPSLLRPCHMPCHTDCRTQLCMMVVAWACSLHVTSAAGLVPDSPGKRKRILNMRACPSKANACRMQKLHFLSFPLTRTNMRERGRALKRHHICSLGLAHDYENGFSFMDHLEQGRAATQFSPLSHMQDVTALAAPPWREVLPRHSRRMPEYGKLSMVRGREATCRGSGPRGFLESPWFLASTLPHPNTLENLVVLWHAFAGGKPCQKLA